MLYETIPTLPVSDLRNRQAEVVAQLNDTPIMLSDTGILVHPKKWDELMKEIARLQRLVKFERTLAEMKAGNYVEAV